MEKQEWIYSEMKLYEKQWNSKFVKSQKRPRGRRMYYDDNVYQILL